MTNEHSITIPESLYNQCEKRITKTEFESVEDYLLFIAKIVVDGNDKPNDDSKGNEKPNNKQLRALGYLD